MGQAASPSTAIVALYNPIPIPFACLPRQTRHPTPPACLSAQATTGTGSPLDIVPTKPHQRAPIYLGCARDVDLVLRYLTEEEAAPEGAAAPAGATPSA